jgi:hypothetical protein
VRIAHTCSGVASMSVRSGLIRAIPSLPLLENHKKGHAAPSRRIVSGCQTPSALAHAAKD